MKALLFALSFLLCAPVFAAQPGDKLAGCEECKPCPCEECECEECHCHHHCKMELVKSEPKLYPGTMCPKGMEMQGWRYSANAGYQAQCVSVELKSVCPAK